MKTIKASVLFAAAVSAVSLMSCSKDISSPSDPEKKFSTITLTVESPSDEDATKTQIGTPTGSSYPVNWSEDDAIAVSAQGAPYFNEYILIDGAGTTSGTFYGEFVEGPVYAYYPYSQVNSVSGDTYTVNIPSQQTFASNSFGEGALPMYGTANSTGNLHSLVPLMSVLKLPLKGTCKVQRIVVSSGSNYLSGSATVTFDGEEASLAFSPDGAFDYVELICNPAVQLSESDAMLFHIAVPATDAGDSYKVRIITDESKVLEKTLTLSKPFTAGKMKKTAVLPNVSPTEVKYVEGSYCGTAITVGGKIWAPVNCGYEATYYEYGKLYQWGRKYGQGYKDDNYEDGDYPGKVGGKQQFESISVSLTSHPDGDIYNGKFYISETVTNWYGGSSPGMLWDLNEGTGKAVSKSAYDPCPYGWRVPKNTEFYDLTLTSTKKEWTATGGPASNQSGYLFGNSPDQLFLPAAGTLGYQTGKAVYRNSNAYYWSSSVNFSYENKVQYLYFEKGGSPTRYGTYHSQGFSVRCVKE